MARFIGTLRGEGQEVTRLGTTAKGLTIKADAWEAGVTVTAEANHEQEEFFIYATSGSNHRASSKYIGKVISTPTGFEFIPDKGKEKE